MALATFSREGRSPGNYALRQLPSKLEQMLGTTLGVDFNRMMQNIWMRKSSNVKAFLNGVMTCVPNVLVSLKNTYSGAKSQ